MFGLRWTDDDALEARETGLSFYYPDEPEADRWAYAEIGETTGVHGCGVSKPNARWVFVMDDGAVFCFGGGSAGFERSVTSTKGAFFRMSEPSERNTPIASDPGAKSFAVTGRIDGCNSIGAADRLLA